MKNLLIYQTSEYDCGPVSVINALRYLFHREELLPDLLKNVHLYTLDTCDENGDAGKFGTSAAAMSFLSSWFNQYSTARKFPLKTEFLLHDEVILEKGSRLHQALAEGSCVVIHVFQECPHYVLLTGVEDDKVLFFDPFYEEQDDPTLEADYFEEGIEMHFGPSKRYNRKVTMERFNRTTRNYYEMGEYFTREALIFTRTTPCPDTMESQLSFGK